ncbi:pyridoxal-phosphate dependent enzyme [Sphaerisporangium sp. NPDC051011]|uniref:PLP-dependent cysteine synthase family protein n=1 Tax=Sphaerisporangium sp. NPDC051011 TaxID=3155792 RepID=UPI0033E8E2DD
MDERDLPVAARERRWARDALAALRADARAEPPTPLRHYPLPPEWDISLYLKDESLRPTGSLKHGTARRLFEDAIACGHIGEHTTVVAATAGNAAVSGAYFAGMLGLPFVAVVPGRTTSARRAGIEAFGGRCHPFDPPLAIYDEARRLAGETGGHYLDHFQAAHAEDWRGDGGLAATLLGQVAEARGDVPRWLVVGAGTGVTSATLGRHLRYHGHPSLLAVVDPENSAYLPSWVTGYPGYGTGMPSRIEGIGRPRVEPAFLPAVVDLMIPVPDAASVAATRHLAAVTGWEAGPSTGANLWGALRLAARMRERGERGAVATLICDGANAYRDTFYDDAWVAGRGLDLAPHAEVIERFVAEGVWAGS